MLAPWPKPVRAQHVGPGEAFPAAGHVLVDGVRSTSPRCRRARSGKPLPDALRQRLLEMPLPEWAHSLDEVVATALRDVLPHAMGNGHPAFFGWVNPPPSADGVLASLAGRAGQARAAPWAASRRRAW
jgi:aromatic-L-amino-acid/L-tryptophan decarboxylase